ncbi:MAG: dihydroneopterin aldolase [Prevotellaceae bacterium]|jgi:dihydroneopterin aldolase|nr:dihydroneopterin aldolase [Prevotellaceae bacterium]
MEGTIELENMEFFARHGCGEEERTAGGIFLVSLRIATDAEQASESDNLLDALDYQAAYNIVAREMATPSSLLEHVARRILAALYDELSGIRKATVKVSKLNPPLGGKVEKSSVSLSR